VKARHRQLPWSSPSAKASAIHSGTTIRHVGIAGSNPLAPAIQESDGATPLAPTITQNLGAIIAVIGVMPGVAPVVIPIGLITAATGPVIDWVDTTFCNQHGVAINLPVVGPDNIGC
jgi:hypothetical protein